MKQNKKKDEATSSRKPATFNFLVEKDDVFFSVTEKYVSDIITSIIYLCFLSLKIHISNMAHIIHK